MVCVYRWYGKNAVVMINRRTENRHVVKKNVSI